MAFRRGRPSSDPFAELGLGAGATADDVRRARQRLAKRAHPDVGGSAAEMQRVNAAADEALRLLGATVEAPTIDPPATRPDTPETRRPGGRVGRDHPSFTVEALPAEAFEAILIAASILGDVVDDDPPYRLEAHLTDAPRAWCRLDIVPDGGGSTVSLTVASDEGATVNQVRDRFVVELNRLDWTDDGPRPRLPS
ncbi:MAG: J domain-containing protein [Ilumatobacter sp.]|nr:J domain-containing protein [Ilumatobacter sp.]